MANRQSIPVTNLLGATAEKELKGAVITLGDKREMPDDEKLIAAGAAVDVTNLMLKYKQKTDDQSARLNVASTLQSYRQQLMNADTLDDFDNISKQSETIFKNGIGNNENEKNFWRENGAKIMELNRRDTENLRCEKMAEFGKKSLQQMLSDNQNVLAVQPMGKGENLLQQGVDEINVSPFLTDSEKEQYCTDYLKTGILNLALQSSDDALSAAENYFPDNEEIKEKISEINGLRLKAEERAQKAKEEAQAVTDVTKSLRLWQQKETGEIDEAAYYVLRQQLPADNFVEVEKKKSATPLYDAYRLLKEKSYGEGFNSQEMRTLGNSFISAYQQHKIGLNEAIDWQNQFIRATGFEAPVNDAIDKIFGADTTAHSADANNFMEYKAKLAMEFYETFAAEKAKQLNRFSAEGGVITPAVERQLSFDALNVTKEHLGFKEGNMFSFDGLKQAMRAVYQGNQTDEIWQQFYRQAPYAEDKEKLMRKLAAAAEKKELNLPKFESYEDVLKAHLSRGEKFYFRGRLAQWS